MCIYELDNIGDGLVSNINGYNNEFENNYTELPNNINFSNHENQFGSQLNLFSNSNYKENDVFYINKIKNFRLNIQIYYQMNVYLQNHFQLFLKTYKIRFKLIKKERLKRLKVLKLLKLLILKTKYLLYNKLKHHLLYLTFPNYLTYPMIMSLPIVH